jgi:hypothetical protein
LKTLVAVLATHVRPYPALIRTAKRTWASRTAPDVDVLFYYGGSRPRRQGMDLHLLVPDDFPHIGEKTLACFEYVLDNVEFDVLFRTNCSSYVDLLNLGAWVDGHARPEGFYAGVVDRHDGVAFASGSGYFLSADLVRVAVAERAAWDHGLLDDVALGELLSGKHVEPTQAPRVTYTNPSQVDRVDTTQFHFRCKTDSRFRADDIEVMERIHRAFSTARGLPPSQGTPFGDLNRAGRRAARALRHLRHVLRAL